jgi:hypothetical protein
VAAAKATRQYASRGIQQETEDAGPIVLIDSDNRRGLQLAPRPGEAANPDGDPPSYAFKYLHLSPPFDPLSYLEAVESASLLGPSVVIIDNVSDEWNGEGGMLEEVDDNQARNQFGAWKEPKRKHKRLMARLRQLNCPVILTTMAEDKLALKGGTAPVHIGWTPVCCRTPPLPRDLTFHWMVGADGKPGTLSTSREQFDHAKSGIGAASLIPDGTFGTEDVGRTLARWAAGRRELAAAA